MKCQVLWLISSQVV